MAKREPNIPYGVDFLSAIGSFDSQGNHTPPKGSRGLSCATFVLEILRGLGFQVISENTWPTGVNGAWVESICNELAVRKPIADEEHIAAVRAASSVARIKPEEAAAALVSVSQEWPLTFDDVQTPAVVVLAAVNEFCPNWDSAQNVAAAAVRILVAGSPNQFGMH